jgi:serine/threonine protein kinase
MRICPRCRSTYAEETDFCGIDGERLLEQDIDPLIGERIDRYEFVERLGGGAMGVVYRARHTELDRYFAIKVLYGEIGANKSLVGRFRREAQAVSKISHPNIISVVDFGTTDNGLNFLVMENVDGETLSDAIAREGAFVPERAAWITSQLASALGAAHRLGFIHRDVKPTNVMLFGDPGFEGVKLLDFGIVGITDGQHTTKLTGTGRIVGTPRYMSPEQARGSGVGPAADLYSLGVILYEMLAGQVPFPGDVMADVLVLHSTMPPPTLPPSRGLDMLAMWLLQKKPEERPADASIVVDEIRKNFPELATSLSPASTSHPSLAAPSITSIAPWDEDQIPTTRPHRADDDEPLETPDLVSDFSVGVSSDLYDSAPELSTPGFDVPRPTSDFDPQQLQARRAQQNAAIFSTLGTGTDQIPVPPAVTERSWWGRQGPLIGMISLMLSLTALGIVFTVLRDEDPESEAEIARKLQEAEQRARLAETQAKFALMRAQRAEQTALKLVDTSTKAQVESRAKPKPKKQRDALQVAERNLRRALRDRGLVHSDLQLLPTTRKLAVYWMEIREKDREGAAKVVTELVERTKNATITNQLLWKKFARLSKDLHELAKTKPKVAAALDARRNELKKQLNQKRLTQQKRESISKSLTELELEIARR